MTSHPLVRQAQPDSDSTAPASPANYDWLIATYSRDLIALLAPCGDIVYASPSFRTVLGYAPGQLIGQPFFGLLHPADLASLLEQWPQVVASCTVQTICRAQHGDGGWRWLSLSLHAADERSQQIVCVAENVTERRRTELQLARLLRQNDLILNSITEGMFGVDLSGNATFMNAAAARMLGWEPVEFFGRPVHTAVLHTRPDGGPFAEQDSPLLGAIRDGQIHRVTDGIFWRKNGTPLPVDYVCTPIVQSDTIAGSVVVFQDITERRELQLQFLQAQKMESIGRLAGSVAHDFNNLLTGIIGYANLASMAIAPDDPLLESLQEIEKSGYRAAALTRQLLAFARKQAFELRVMLLNDLLTDLEKLLQRLVGLDIVMELLLGDDVGVILGDSGQLSQVVVNLVVNARDAMANSGRLTLQTMRVDFGETDPRRPVHLPPGPYVALIVSDTGCGMPPEVIARIFEPFFTTKESGAGTGLGLATCFGIVQQHGGAITVASEVGRGTTFYVYLPRSSADDAPLAGAPADAPALLDGTETLLVVEDDDTVRRLICAVLRASGYTVIETSNGEQALLHAQQQQLSVDLLIADIVMPGLRGTTLAHQFTALRPATRVLFISGQIDDEIVQHGQLLPGLHFLAKPFSGHDLLRKVRQILDA